MKISKLFKAMSKSLKDFQNLKDCPQIFHPYKLTFDFDYAKNEFKENLANKSKATFDIVGPKSCYPLPILLTQRQLDEMEKIQEALCLAIKCIVSNYHQDERIQSIYKFSNQIKSILDLYKEKSYFNIGSYRFNFGINLTAKNFL